LLTVHTYIGVLDGDLTDYVLTANSSTADKSYTCMHAHNTHTHTHTVQWSEKPTLFPFMEGRGATKYHSKCSFIDKLFTQLHKTWATASICMHPLILTGDNTGR
jgi:hypothetical protein